MMLLLSRTAEDLYWLGRHLERAESLARVVKEHTNLLVDLPVTVESDWSSLLAITGTTERYGHRDRLATEADVTGFLLLDRENPGSLVRTVAAARENLRVTRQIVPWTAWECLNRIHMRVQADAERPSSRSGRLALCDAVIDAGRHLRGILQTTMTRDHAYGLIDVGAQLERADMTTRVLDVRAGDLVRSGATPGLPIADRSPYEDVRWLSVLRSVGGLQMYHRSVSGPVEGEAVLRFLLSHRGFPRSVAHCAGELDWALASLPAAPEARLACTRVVAEAADPPAAPIDPAGLHDYLDGLQVDLGAIHDELTAAYFTPEALLDDHDDEHDGAVRMDREALAGQR